MVAFSEPITCEVRRIYLPRTPVNKDTKEGRVVRSPGSLSHLALDLHISPISPCTRQPHRPSLGVDSAARVLDAPPRTLLPQRGTAPQRPYARRRWLQPLPRPRRRPSSEPRIQAFR